MNMKKAEDILEKGNIAMKRGNMKKAILLFSSAKEILETEHNNNIELRMDVLHNIMRCHHYIGDINIIFSLSNELSDLATVCENKNLLIENHKQLGNMWWKMGLHHMALDEYDAGLLIAEEEGDKANFGALLFGRGMVESELGLFDDADVSLSSAIEILKENGKEWRDILNTGLAYNGLALNHEYAGRYDKAISGFRKTIAIASEEGNRMLEEFARVNLARVLVVTRNFNEAKEHLTIATHLDESVGNDELMGGVCIVRALIELYDGDYAEANILYEDAEQKMKKKLSTADAGMVSYVWGRALEEMGLVEEASRSLKMAQEYFWDIGNETLSQQTEKILAKMT